MKQRRRSTGSVPAGSRVLIEGRDFYWEGGLMVLTADFLEGRGYCCDSGCRHCPYGRSKGENPGEPL